MFFSQMGHFMQDYIPTYPFTHLPTYILPTQLCAYPPPYNLPTYYPPTHLPRCITHLPIHPFFTYLHFDYLFNYIHIHPPITYLHINCLTTQLPIHAPTWMHNLPTYPPTCAYLHTCTTYIHTTHPPTCLFTYPPAHPPISYNLPTFIFHSLVVMC